MTLIFLADPLPAAAQAPQSYEAESGTLANGAVVFADPAASGGAMVGNLHLPGASLTLPHVSGGTQGGGFVLQIRYAAGFPLTGKDLFVNGTFSQTILFGLTGGWSGSGCYQTVSVPVRLRAGDNTLTLQTDSGQDGTGVNPDVFTLIPLPSRVTEAESGTLAGGATLLSDPDASGGACVGSFQNPGASVTVSGVDGATGGAQSLVIRYAQPWSPVTENLYVNGTLVGAVSFAQTGGWTGPTAYGTVSVLVTLQAGATNSVMLRNDAATGAVNVDTFSVQPFAITGINNGDTLSGDVNAAVNVTGAVGMLSVSVDGSEFGSDNITQVGNGGNYGAGFGIPTNRFANGSHVISVRDAAGNVDTRTVTFSNPTSNLNYDAMFDPTPGTTDLSHTCHITAQLSSSQAWTVSITDSSGNPVRSFSGSSTAVDATWDGTNASGQMVSADAYQVTLTAADTTTFLVNIDNYADSIIILNYEVFGGDGDKARRNNALQHEKFIKGELSRYVGIDFNYPILVSVIGDYDISHDPHLIERIKNKFRRPAVIVDVETHGEYHDFKHRVPVPTGKLTDFPLIHPYFVLGGQYCFYSAFAPEQTTNGTIDSNDTDVSALTSSLEYGYSREAPFVWMGTCVSAAGGPKLNVDDFSGGRNPQDFQWGNTFGISTISGVFLGSIDYIPFDYDPSYYDWTIWERNFIDFMGAGDNNFYTALSRSFSVESFTSNPSPPQAMVWTGNGSYAF